MGVIGKQGAPAHGAFRPARYVFNPSARRRGLALARDFSCDIRLPVRGLDGGVDFTEFLGEVVALLLQIGDLERGDPFDLGHAVAVGFFSTGCDRSLKHRVMLGERVALGYRRRERSAVRELGRLIRRVDPQADVLKRIENADRLLDELRRILVWLLLLLHERVLCDPLAQLGQFFL